MAKKYVVRISFEKKVSKAGLARAVGTAAKQKMRGFSIGEINTHETYEEPIRERPIRIRRKK